MKVFINNLQDLEDYESRYSFKCLGPSQQYAGWTHYFEPNLDLHLYFRFDSMLQRRLKKRLKEGAQNGL